MNSLIVAAVLILAGFLAYGLGVVIRAARQEPRPPSIAD
jgi:hypothetical protein